MRGPKAGEALGFSAISATFDLPDSLLSRRCRPRRDRQPRKVMHLQPTTSPPRDARAQILIWPSSGHMKSAHRAPMWLTESQQNRAGERGLQRLASRHVLCDLRGGLSLHSEGVEHLPTLSHRLQSRGWWWVDGLISAQRGISGHSTRIEIVGPQESGSG